MRSWFSGHKMNAYIKWNFLIAAQAHLLTSWHTVVCLNLIHKATKPSRNVYVRQLSRHSWHLLIVQHSQVVYFVPAAVCFLVVSMQGRTYWIHLRSLWAHTAISDRHNDHRILIMYRRWKPIVNPLDTGFVVERWTINYRTHSGSQFRPLAHQYSAL